MKKIIVVFALLLSLSAAAQNFPYRKIELLIGKEVQIKPLTEGQLKYTGGYEEFSTDVKGIYTYQEGKSVVTKPSALVDRVFKVESIESNPIDDDVSMLKLKDSKGEIIYYQYKQDFPTPFNVLGGVVLPEDYFCQYIEETNDKSTGVQMFKVKRGHMYELTKSKKDKIVKYTLYLETNAYPRDHDGKGVIILLENNKQIKKPTTPVKIKIKASCIYTATFELTPADITLLKDNKIIDYRLFENDGFISADGAEVFQGALQCMLAK